MMVEHWHVTVRHEPGCVVERVETVESFRDAMDAVARIAQERADAGSIHTTYHSISDGYVMVQEYGQPGYTIVSATLCTAGACATATYEAVSYR